MSQQMMTSDFVSNAYMFPYAMPTKVEIFDAPLYQQDFEYTDTSFTLNKFAMDRYPISHHPPSPESSETSLSPPPETLPTFSIAGQSISEKIMAKASSLPDPFLLEVHQYSKETYERGTSNSKKRRRVGDVDDLSDNEDGETNSVSVAETRRQIHIQSEQKRRAQIKDGFEDLRNQLPGCLNKKMSKAALLHRTVLHIQHLKATQGALLAELQKLIDDNEQLRSFQQAILQKQALETIYLNGQL